MLEIFKKWDLFLAATKNLGFRWEKHLHRILWNLSIWRWLAAFFLNHLHLKPIQTNTSCINVWGDHFSYHSYDQKGVPNRGWFLTIGSAFGSLTVASFTHRSWKTRHRSVWHQRGKKGIWFACTHTDTYTYIYIYTLHTEWASILIFWRPMCYPTWTIPRSCDEVTLHNSSPEPEKNIHKHPRMSRHEPEIPWLTG